MKKILLISLLMALTLLFVACSISNPGQPAPTTPPPEQPNVDVIQPDAPPGQPDWVAPDGIPSINATVWTYVVVRESITAATQADGSLWVWGSHSRLDAAVPRKIMDDVVAVSIDHQDIVAVRTDGNLWRWSARDRNDAEIAMENVTAVAGPLAIRADGSLWVWTFRPEMLLDSGVRTIAVCGARRPEGIDPSNHGAIRADGSLWTWRRGESPTWTMDNVVSVACGLNHTAVVRTDGSLWAWGLNHQGQVGDGTTTDRDEPVWVMDGVASVFAGKQHTLAVKTDGSLWVWGYFTGNHSPTKIMDDVMMAAAAEAHSFAIKTDGSLWAWGSNNMGELGDGTTIGRPDPVRIMENVGSSYVAPPLDQISPPDGGSAHEWAVSVFEFEQDLPHGFTLAWTSPDLENVEYSNAHTGVNVSRGELFGIESNDGITVTWHSVRITVIHYGIPATDGGEVVIEIDQERNRAMVINNGENGFTYGLASFLRELIAEVGG